MSSNDLIGELMERWRIDDAPRRALIASHINVSRRVLNRRLDLGLSQAALARLAKTTQARISHVEALRGNVNFDTLDRIARALGLVIDLVPPSSDA